MPWTVEDERRGDLAEHAQVPEKSFK